MRLLFSFVFLFSLFQLDIIFKISLMIWILFLVNMYTNEIPFSSFSYLKKYIFITNKRITFAIYEYCETFAETRYFREYNAEFSYITPIFRDSLGLCLRYGIQYFQSFSVQYGYFKRSQFALLCTEILHITSILN